MPFNKGDFTQQGVAGHVNAKIRLNEKRLVNIDLTSNEEAEGCTISGTVTDLLNDKVYPIGSAPSGNIEITENTAEGEPLDISQYATATVNVAGGGGDLPVGKCVVTIVNSAESTKNIDFSNTATPIYLNEGYTPFNNALIGSPDYLGEVQPIIAPGQSLEIICYYSQYLPSGIGYTDDISSYSFVASNIENMTYIPGSSDVGPSYKTTNISLDSSITLTVVHTIKEV